MHEYAEERILFAMHITWVDAATGHFLQLLERADCVSDGVQACSAAFPAGPWSHDPKTGAYQGVKCRKRMLGR